MSVVRITINSVCNTSDNAVTLSNSSGKNQIQWNAAGQNTYTVAVPAGVFQGYSNAGSITVGPNGWTPDPPLTLVTNPTPQTISNYISQNGNGCDDLAGPPQIVIGS
jgi:hypothetical protein